MSSRNLIAELEFERISTQKLLSRLPESRLDWRPHPLSLTLGQLALHIATIPGRIAGFADEGVTKAEVLIDHPIPTSKDQILEKFEDSIQKSIAILERADDEWDAKDWVCVAGETVLIRWPRPIFLRFLMFNHWVHHRGELVTYLRIMDCKIPSVYGPSADENPFA